ncbi:hypothetical protein [Manganibacter manganicus]|uniref:hypothetical protein n=1 Tax=Manganibacter manganicus TaxID=1873176 RepID=UPI001301B040|nr:hypothetical protein [Pseudaminobacter manganicus]
MRIDRWNCGTMRRYHHSSRAILVCYRNDITGDKLACIIPAFSWNVSIPVDRSQAAEMLREWRAHD